MEVTLTNQAVLRSHIVNARGSIARPMTDYELDAKFRAQANLVLPLQKTETLLSLCREISSLPDVGTKIAAVWEA